jgi:hypothetical protein
MFRPQFRWPVPLSLAAIVAVALIISALAGVKSQTGEVAALSQHQKDCAHKGKEYGGARSLTHFPVR